MGQAEARLKEAAKLGFTAALAPAATRPRQGHAAAPGSRSASLPICASLVALFEDAARQGAARWLDPAGRRS